MGQENDTAISIDRENELEKLAVQWASHRRFHELILATSDTRVTELTWTCSEYLVHQMRVEQRIAFQQKRLNIANYSQKEFLCTIKCFPVI